MTFGRFCLPILVLIPALSWGASREFQELQRDVALLQQQIREFQASQNEKMSALTELVRLAVESANKANTGMAVLERAIGQNMKEQAKSVVEPVANVGVRVDQMATEFQALREQMSDVVGRLGKLQQQMVDLSNAVRTMQAPPAPPPTAAAAPPPPAETLYGNARRDMMGGKADLALQGFAEYLKYYGETDMAPSAQYYIGEIHFSQGDFDTALQEFDLVLEKYPDNDKSDDALYMKGQTLVKMGRRTQGAQEFQDLIKRFPTSDLSKKACAQLTAMGLRCPPARATPSRKKRS